jgi:L-lactate dehydrogenase complex protein LldG
MSNARSEILDRIRSAQRGELETPQPTVRSYRLQSDADPAAIQRELIDKIRDYGAEVRADILAPDLPAVIAETCRKHSVRRLAVPGDLPPDWLPAECEILRDGPPLTSDELDHCDGVLSGCALAIAQTGTLVLDGGSRQGRRALTLVPDLHICVVAADQIVGLVPEGLARLEKRTRNPITFISGPSATSDIELSRVEGVHGPRTLIVLVVIDGVPDASAPT